MIQKNVGYLSTKINALTAPCEYVQGPGLKFGPRELAVARVLKNLNFLTYFLIKI